MAFHARNGAISAYKALLWDPSQLIYISTTQEPDTASLPNLSPKNGNARQTQK